MSLIVDFQLKTQSTDVAVFEAQVGPEYNELFGFEAWRKTLWGAPVMSELGCKLITRLANTDLIVFDEEVLQLQKELVKIKAHAVLVSRRTGVDEEDLLFRVNNALERTRIALNYPDKIGIYIG